jgi:hypothetical protein
MVVHGGSAQEPHAHIVRELDLVDVGAVSLNVGAVVDLVLGVDQSHTGDPVPGLLRMVGIGLVASVPSEASAKVEEAAIGDRVLLGVSSNIIQETEALPCSHIR